MQVPGWAQPLRVYSVDLPWRSSLGQRSQAERLATRIAELTGAGEPAIAGGRVDRIYLTRDLVHAATRYVQQDLRDSEHRALIVTLNGAAVAGAAR